MGGHLGRRILNTHPAPWSSAALITTVTLQTIAPDLGAPLSIIDLGTAGVLGSYPASSGQTVQRLATVVAQPGGNVRVTVSDRKFGTPEFAPVAEYMAAGDLSAVAWLALSDTEPHAAAAA